MVIRVITVVLVLAALAGCTMTPLNRGIEAGSPTGYALGVTVDEEVRVVEVEPDSAAQKAGVEVGDVLVSLTWVLSEVPEHLPSSSDAATDSTPTSLAEANPITQSDTLTEVAALTQEISAPQVRSAPGVETRTVLFTDRDEIRTVISYGVPLRLSLLREGQRHEFTIVPESRLEQPSGAEASNTTPTAGEYF